MSIIEVYDEHALSMCIQRSHNLYGSEMRSIFHGHILNLGKFGDS